MLLMNYDSHWGLKWLLTANLINNHLSFGSNDCMSNILKVAWGYGER